MLLFLLPLNLQISALSLPSQASTAAVFAPSMATTYAMALPLVPSTVVIAPALLLLSPTLPFTASTASVSIPSVAYGDLFMTLPVRGAAAAAFAPTLAVGSVALALPAVAPTTVVQIPFAIAVGAVTVLLPTQGSTRQIFAPGLVAETIIALPAMVSGARFFDPTISTVFFNLPFVVSGSYQVFAPLITPSQRVSLPGIASGVVIHGSQQIGQIITAFTGSAARCFPPMMTSINPILGSLNTYPITAPGSSTPVGSPRTYFVTNRNT